MVVRQTEMEDDEEDVLDLGQEPRHWIEISTFDSKAPELRVKPSVSLQS